MSPRHFSRIWGGNIRRQSERETQVEQQLEQAISFAFSPVFHPVKTFKTVRNFFNGGDKDKQSNKPSI